MPDPESAPAEAIVTTLLPDRRTFLAGLALTVAAGCRTARPARQDPANDARRTRLRELEASAQGRLGAYIFDTRTRTGFGWREDERFAHCSSFKMSLAAMMLRGADRGEVDLGEVLRWGPEAMLPVSPVTEDHIDQGLSVEALAEATLVTSDNTAANVLMKRFGGPAALTTFWRSIGDDVSQLDRMEPELNEIPPGTTLDTTTPRAMASTTAALVHGDVLSASRRATLKRWMTAVQTGSKRIRSGLPVGWESGDKTGTGIGATRHTYVDLAFGGPSAQPPLIVTAYFEPARLVEPMDPVSLEVLATVGRIAAETYVTDA